MSNNRFLPISKEDMKERGWEQCDFIIVTGEPILIIIALEQQLF